MSRGFFYAQIFFKGIKALLTGTDGIDDVVDVVVVDVVQGWFGLCSSVVSVSKYN